MQLEFKRLSDINISDIIAVNTNPHQAIIWKSPIGSSGWKAKRSNGKSMGMDPGHLSLTANLQAGAVYNMKMEMQI
jgi:hypothetical protein